MDLPLLVKRRLRELGLEQKELAAATQVTESYISQLLAHKKAPPAPSRTDLYKNMGRFLNLDSGELSRLADLQRRQHWRQRAVELPRPLFENSRELILRKCEAGRRAELRRVFEREPFGALERLVMQKLLDVARKVAAEQSENETWLRLAAQLSDCSFEQMRVVVLEFQDINIFTLSVENWISFLDPLIEAWDIDLETFGIEIVLNARLVKGAPKRFEFVEKEPEPALTLEPGLEAFLRHPFLSSDATEEEIEFLRRMKFAGRKPTPMYYYRELQSLRDPLHFEPLS